MNAKRLLGLMALCLLWSATAVRAGEIDTLVNSLAEKGIITYGEAQTILTEGREETRSQLAKAELPTLPFWIQNLSMKGDLRLRFQSDWDSSKNYARTRERLRLRLGFDTRIVENVKAGFGLATGTEKTDGTVTSTTAVSSLDIYDAEPTSTNYTFGNGFTKPLVMIDYAYLQWSPYGWLSLVGGKMKNGMNYWEPTDLIWDTDINPDGAAVVFSQTYGAVTPFVNASYLTINELSSTASNPDAYIGQVGADWKITDTISLKAAVAYQQFNVAKKKFSTFFGTPTFDYKLIEPAANLMIKDLPGGYTLNLFADTVTNNEDAVTRAKGGAAYGLSFGDDKIVQFGQWQVKAIQRGLEKYSIPSNTKVIGDSDAYGGSSNSSGYEAIISVGLTGSCQFNLDYYSMELIDKALDAKSGTVPKSLIQFDVVYKF